MTSSIGTTPCSPPRSPRPPRGTSIASLRRLLLLSLLATATATGAACSDSDVGAPDPTAIETLELSQRSITLGVGAAAPLEVTARDAAGRVLPSAGAFWSSSDPAIVRVSTTGIIIAIAPGTAQIAATLQGKSVVATVTVAPKTAAAVRLEPSELRLIAGAQGDFGATVLDAQGGILTGRLIQWRSGNTSIAAVDSTGHVTALAPGATSVTATSEGRSVTGAVIVSAIGVAAVNLSPASATLVEGQTSQLTAEARDAQGRALSGRVVTWTSSVPAVAIVSSAGVVSAIAAGSTVITATSEGRSATSAITVNKRPVSSLTVSPAQLSLTAGQTALLTVLVTDAQGGVLTGRAVTFTSAATGIATVSAAGVVSAVATGTTSITVASEGKTATVGVTVSPIPVASIRVTPAEGNIIVGSRTSFTATPLDASGRALDRPVSWSSGSPTVATVTQDGSVLGVSPGTAVILASTDGRVGSATVTVSAIPVASVEVTPTTTSLDVGRIASLTARVLDAGGSVLTDRNVLWSSSNTAVATVSPAGVVTAIAAGSATISASADGKVGTATITVTRPAADVATRVTVEPLTLTLNWNGPPASRSAPLTAAVFGASRAPLPSAPVAWTSSNEKVATVSSSGVVTAVSEGTATISATSGTAVGTAVVTSTRR